MVLKNLRFKQKMTRTMRLLEKDVYKRIKEGHGSVGKALERQERGSEFIYPQTGTHIKAKRP